MGEMHAGMVGNMIVVAPQSVSVADVLWAHRGRIVIR